MTDRRHLRSSAVVLVLLAAGPFLSHTASAVEPRKSEARPDPVATFHGGAIRRAELDQAIRIRMGGTRVPDTANEETQHQFAVRTLASLVQRRLLLMDAEARGIRAKPDEVRAAVARETRNRGGAKKLAQYLSDVGLTREEYEREVRANLTARRYVDVLVEQSSEQMAITPEALRSEFDANREKFIVPERVRVRHILLRLSENAPPDEDAAVLARITSLRAMLDKGTDLAGVAHRYSECPSRVNGGDLGFFARGEMEPEFEQSAFSLQRGQLSPPVKTRFGYHLIRLEERTPAETGDFESVKDRIANELRERRREEILNKRLNELRVAASVKLLI